MSGIDEETVRRIVREELTSLLKSLDKTASDSIGYETGELEGAALRAISDVMKSEVGSMPHDWKCEMRTDRWFEACTCGVDKEGESNA